MCSATRLQQISLVRASIAERAINEQAATLSEVPRLFNRSASAISRLLLQLHREGLSLPIRLMIGIKAASTPSYALGCSWFR